MAVKDIFSTGAIMPEPIDSGKSDEQPKRSAFMDDVEEAAKRGAQLRAFTQAAGFDPTQSVRQPTTTREEEKTTVDLGSIFRSQTDTTNNLINKVIEARDATPKGSADALFLQHLIEELKDTRNRLEEVRNKPMPQQADPIDVLLSTQSRMKQLTESMREHLGINEMMGNSGGQNISLMLELEKMRNDQAERNRQWEEQMFERRRQYEREDRRWQAEHDLRLREYQDNKQGKVRAGDMVEDLIGSLSSGIDKVKVGQSSPEDSYMEQPPVTQSPGHRPRFKCTCGHDVELPEKGALSVSCQRCNTAYDLTGVN